MEYFTIVIIDNYYATSTCDCAKDFKGRIWNYIRVWQTAIIFKHILDYRLHTTITGQWIIYLRIVNYL